MGENQSRKREVGFLFQIECLSQRKDLNRDAKKLRVGAMQLPRRRISQQGNRGGKGHMLGRQDVIWTVESMISVLK